MAALFVHVIFGDRAPAGPSRQWFQLVPTLVPLVAGLAAGAAVWLLLKNQRRGRELEAANRALAQINERLKREASVALQSEQRFHLLFSSNPCPMWIFDCRTLAMLDVNDA